jgi:hypothetical protein
MNTRVVIQKFEQILASVSQADQDQLAAELAKIVPNNAESLKDWRATWSYNFDSKQLRIFMSVLITDFKQTANQSLSNLFSLFLTSAEFCQETELVFDKMLHEPLPSWKFSVQEVRYLQPENMAVLMFECLGAVSESNTDYVTYKNEAHGERNLQQM